MKVFIDGVIFGRQRFGGVSKVWEELLTRLSAYDLDVELLVPCRARNASLQHVLSGQHHYQVRHDCLYWPARIFDRVPVRSRLLRWLHVDRAVDIFHSTFTSTIYSRRVRKVATVHDLIPELFEARKPGKWTAMTLGIRRRVFENADHLIAVSQNTRDDLLRLYPEVSPERVSVIYHGADSAGPPPDVELALEELERKYHVRLADGGYYLQVGNRHDYKNFDLILEWFGTREHERDAHFVCVGGENTRRLRQEATARGIADAFTFVPFVTDAGLAALYRHARALVYPSKYEGFGLPVLEAMSHGCPVLCADTSSLPEIGGDAALYFAPDSPASLSAAFRQLEAVSRDDLVARGRRNVARFSWEESTRRLVEVYERLG